MPWLSGPYFDNDNTYYYPVAKLEDFEYTEKSYLPKNNIGVNLDINYQDLIDGVDENDIKFENIEIPEIEKHYEDRIFKNGKKKLDTFENQTKLARLINLEMNLRGLNIVAKVEQSMTESKTHRYRIDINKSSNIPFSLYTNEQVEELIRKCK